MKSSRGDERDYLHSLDGLRGIAALLIFFHHIPAWYKPFSDIPLIKNSYLMVELFFVLSGFLIVINYGARQNSWKNVFAFLALRLGRLYPVHFVFLILFAGLEILKFLYISDSLIPPFSKNGLREFIENFTLTQALGFSNNAASFNSPSWSISVEFYTYVLFSLTVLLIGKKNAPFPFLFIAMCAAFLLASHSSEIAEFHLVLRCLSGFFLGCLMGLAYENAKERINLLPRIFITPAIVAAMAIFLHIKPTDSDRFDLIFVILSSMLIFTIASDHGNGNTIFSSRFFVFLGELSYSLYMTHYFVIHVFGSWLYRYSPYAQPALSLTSVTNGKTVVSLDFLQAIALYSTLIGITFALSFIILHGIERPLRARSRGFVKRWLLTDYVKPKLVES